MADVNTRIRITADEATARRMGRSLNDAFSPKALQGLRKEAKGLEMSLASITKQLPLIGRGASNYRLLTRELRSATDEANKLATALGRVQAARSGGGPGPGGGGGGGYYRQQARRSFWGGLMQGAGLSHYMPAEHGLGARTAGTLLGGAASRIFGAVASPFLMPGMGGLVTGLSHLPFGIGTFAAGAAQTAAGAYSEAVGYDRARHANLVYAGAIPGRRFVRPRENAEHAREVAAAKSRQRERDSGKQSPAIAELERQGIPVADPNPSHFKEPMPLWTGGDALQARLDEIDAQINKDAARRGRRVRGKGVRVGKGAVDAGELKNFTETGPRLGFGVEYGVGPMEMQSLYGEFMGARGGVWSKPAKFEFDQALAAKVGYNVSAGQAGAYSRMGRAGGGGMGTAGMASTLEAATFQGLSGSQVNEYLAQLVQLGQNAERQGVKIDERGFATLTSKIVSMGPAFGGMQAARVSGEFSKAGLNTSNTGLATPEDMVWLQAFGYDPARPETYWKAKKASAGEGGPGTFERGTSDFVRAAAGHFRGSGLPQEGQEDMLRSFLRRKGINVGYDQAASMLRGEDPDKVRAMAGEAGAEGRLTAFGKQRAGLAGLAKESAGLEAKKISTGYESKWVAGFERAALDAAGALNVFKGELKGLADVVRGSMKLLTTALKILKSGQKL